MPTGRFRVAADPLSAAFFSRFKQALTWQRRQDQLALDGNGLHILQGLVL